MRKVIRLTESDLHRIIKKSVNNIIREWGEYIPDPSDYLDEEPLNRWYREHPGVEPPDTEEEYLEYENEDDFDDYDYYEGRYPD